MIHVFVPEDFGRLAVRGDFFRIVPADLVKLAFADLAGGEKVVVPVGITVPGKVHPLPVDRSESVTEADLVRDDTEIRVVADVYCPFRLFVLLQGFPDEEIDERIAAFEPFRDRHDQIPRARILPIPLEKGVDRIGVDDRINPGIGQADLFQDFLVDQIP